MKIINNTNLSYKEIGEIIDEINKKKKEKKQEVDYDKSETFNNKRNEKNIERFV